MTPAKLSEILTQHALWLVVRRDTMNPKLWRLAWDDGSTSFTNAEGECSAIYYPTMRAAIAAGVTRFNETARKADF